MEFRDIMIMVFICGFKSKNLYLGYNKFNITVVIPKSIPVLSTESVLRKMAVHRELQFSTEP